MLVKDSCVQNRAVNRIRTNTVLSDICFLNVVVKRRSHVMCATKNLPKTQTLSHIWH